MTKKKILAPGVALLASAAVLSAAPAAGAATVSVRVEGKTRTLLAARSVSTTGPAVRRGGHVCAGNTGMGAFDRAVRGHWSGQWFSGLGFEPETILGEVTSYTRTHSYFELFVNHVAAQVGLCGLKVKRGERLLLADVPATGTEYPLGIQMVSRAYARRSVTVTVVRYDAKGRAHRLPGASVRLGSKTITTGAAGTAVVRPTKAGTYKVRVAKAGFIRDEATLRVRL